MRQTGTEMASPREGFRQASDVIRVRLDVAGPVHNACVCALVERALANEGWRRHALWRSDSVIVY